MITCNSNLQHLFPPTAGSQANKGDFANKGDTTRWTKPAAAGANRKRQAADVNPSKQDKKKPRRAAAATDGGEGDTPYSADNDALPVDFDKLDKLIKAEVPKALTGYYKLTFLFASFAFFCLWHVFSGVKGDIGRLASRVTTLERKHADLEAFAKGGLDRKKSLIDGLASQATATKDDFIQRLSNQKQTFEASQSITTSAV